MTSTEKAPQGPVRSGPQGLPREDRKSCETIPPFAHGTTIHFQKRSFPRNSRHFPLFSKVRKVLGMGGTQRMTAGGLNQRWHRFYSDRLNGNEMSFDIFDLLLIFLWQGGFRDQMNQRLQTLALALNRDGGPSGQTGSHLALSMVPPKHLAAKDGIVRFSTNRSFDVEKSFGFGVLAPKSWSTRNGLHLRSTPR